MYDKNIIGILSIYLQFLGKKVLENIFSSYLKWSYAPRRKFDNVRNKYSIIKLKFIPPYLNLNAKIVQGILIANECPRYLLA